MCVQCRCSIGPTVQITATMWMHARLSLLPPLTMMTTTNYSNCFTTKNLFSGDNSHTQINMNKKLRAGNGLWWSWFFLPSTHTFQLISIVCVQVGFSTSFFLLILLFFQIMYTHFFFYMSISLFPRYIAFVQQNFSFFEPHSANTEQTNRATEMNVLIEMYLNII